MKKYQKFFQKLEKANGTINKKILLNDMLQDAVFQRICNLALNPKYSFKIASVSPPLFPKEKKTTGDILDLLEQFAEQSGVSKEDKKQLVSYCTTPAKVDVVNRILRKNLGCSVAAAAINKACPGLIPVFSYQRCSTFKKIDNITFPALIQPKMDGLFTNVFSNKVLSRKGKPFLFCSTKLYRDIKKLHDCAEKEYIFLGEGLATSPKTGEILDRQTSNGILTKAIKGTISESESESVVFIFWDIVPLSKWSAGKSYHIPYEERLALLDTILEECDNPRFQTIPTFCAETKEKAVQIAEGFIEDGGEGAVVKSKNFIWCNSTSKFMIKIKAEETCDLVIVDWEYGKAGGKYEHGLGGYVCETRDGKLRVTVGTGLLEKYRLSKTEVFDNAIGKIVEVTYGNKIQDKKGSLYSLYLPRFVGNPFRVDKDIADSIEEVE